MYKGNYVYNIKTLSHKNLNYILCLWKYMYNRRKDKIKNSI